MTFATASTSKPPSSGTLAYLSPVDKETAWAVVDTVEGGERVLRTTDGAASWHDVTPSQLKALVTSANVAAGSATPDVLFLGSTRAWTSADGWLVATTDGGRTWRNIAQLPAACVPFQFVDPTHGWCEATGAAMGSESVVLYRTVDAGLHWQRVSAAKPGSTSKGTLPFQCEKPIRFTSETVGWAGLSCSGYVSHVYETTDAGTYWSARTIGAIPSSLAKDEISVVPPMLSGVLGAGVMLVNNDVVMYRSENRGASWRAVVPPGRLQPWDADVISPLQWRLADDRHIESTDTGGRTWTTITPNWPIPPAKAGLNLPDLSFASPQVAWGTYYEPNGSVVIRTTDGGAQWTKVRSPA